MVERVALTPAAADLLVGLTRVHGPLMFHQSGGCCDGSAPMCYPLGEFKLGGTDIHLGDLEVAGIAPIGFHMSRSQFDYWKHTHLTVDVVPGRGSGFSLEAPGGVRFVIRSRLLPGALQTPVTSIPNGVEQGNTCVGSQDPGPKSIGESA